MILVCFKFQYYNLRFGIVQNFNRQVVCTMSLIKHVVVMLLAISVLPSAILGVSFPEAPTMRASCSLLADILSKKEKYTRLDAVIERIAAPLYDIMFKVGLLGVVRFVLLSSFLVEKKKGAAQP